ncbi:hypothetical protein [Clavibacter sp. Sh2036]|uniref:hypothetical protein n=1 Tax=unclassified Clavibacter TaxID=2626594 RepID=UPI0039E15D6B
MSAPPAGTRRGPWDPVDRVIAFVTSRALLLGATLGLAYLTAAVTGDELLTDPLIPGSGFGAVLVPPLAGVLTLLVWLCASGAVRLARRSRVASLVGLGACGAAEAALVAAGIPSTMNVRPVSVVGAVVLAGGSAALLLRAHGAVGGRARVAAP